MSDNRQSLPEIADIPDQGGKFALEPDGRLSTESRVVIGGLWMGNLFSPFLIASVVALLPGIGRDLNATAVELSLIMVVYMLSQVIFSVLGGRFGDLWGLRRMLLAGVACFTVTTIAMGFAPGMPAFLSLRFVQGGAGALMSACTMAIAVNLTPPSRRGRVMGILTSAVYLGLTLGPLIGGGMGTLLHWRWFFIAIAVPGLAVWLVLRRSIRQEWRGARGEKLDVPGALLLTAALALFALGASSGGLAPWIVWLTPLGALFFGAFLLWEKRAAYPLVSLGIFRETRGLGSGLLAVLINYGSFMGAAFLFSLYLQHVRGFTPFHAGLVLMLQSVMQVIFSPIGGRLADSLGAERVSAAGMLLCGAGILGAALLNADSPLAVLLAAQIMLGVGVGFFNAPNMVATLRNVQPRQIALASGLIGSMRTMGGLCSQVIASVVIGVFMGDAMLGPDNVDSFMRAMRASLVCFGMLNICGLGLGLGRLRKRAL